MTVLFGGADPECLADGLFVQTHRTTRRHSNRISNITLKLDMTTQPTATVADDFEK
jgi:hypothetical protein